MIFYPITKKLLYDILKLLKNKKTTIFNNNFIKKIFLKILKIQNIYNRLIKIIV